jgi:uncharacterized protein (DUF1778 family)
MELWSFSDGSVLTMYLRNTIRKELSVLPANPRSVGNDMETATTERLRHDTSVTMRMPLQTKELIEKAATTVNKTFSAFVVESAREHAVDVLLNQTVFNLSADQAEAFAQALENPPAPTERLKRLMQSNAPWE